MAGVVCNSCGEPKTVEEMSKDRSDKRGYRGTCKQCMNKKSEAYRQKNTEKQRTTVRLAARKRRFALLGEGSEAHYAEQRSIQQNECAICFQPLTKACSDHDHVTGRWRGMLCDCCNRAIGLLKDDIKVLASAIAYLTKWA
jgi:hypothetical protein